jgi:hypothetical protein
MFQATRAAIPSRRSSNAEAKARPRMALGRVSNAGRTGGVPTARKSQVINKSPSVHPSSTTAASIIVPSVEPRQEFHFSPVPIGDFSDPMDVAEYEHIIYRSMRERELAAPQIVFNQTLITIKDRNLLIDALCRFHYKLGLMTNTFYRFLGIFDRFLAKENVQPSKLKLYGCAAFLIASKIEDIYPAQSTDLIKLSDRAFSQRELFAAEIEVINAISFDTTFATPLFYLTQFMRIEEETKENLLLARYVLEAMQSFEHCFGMPASKMASLAVLITRFLKGKPLWPASFEGYTKYSLAELDAHAKCIREMLSEEDREETRFMRRKYGCEAFLGVARTRIPPSFP